MTKKKEVVKRTPFDIFAGDFVQIITKHMVERNIQNENGIEMIRNPMAFEGFLTDECDDYYYLGEEPDAYNRCVRKEDVVVIEVAAQETESPMDKKIKENTGYN